MKKKMLLKNTAYVLGAGLAIVIAAMAALMCVDVIDTLAEDQLKEASYCSFVIPP